MMQQDDWDVIGSVIYLKAQKIPSESLDRLVAKNELIKLSDMKNVMKHFLIQHKNCTDVRNNFSKAVSVAKSYKSLLFSQQDELKFCQSQQISHKKILSSTNNFYLYLLKRLAQIGDGIRHLKAIGNKLR